MQINDVHDHLEELNALRDVAYRTDDLGLVLRAGLVVEICALLELTFGAPPGVKAARDGASLLDLTDRERGEGGYDRLVHLRDDVVGVASRTTLRELRERVGAHMDEHLTLQDIVDTLCGIDVKEYIGLADTMLDHLDAAASAHVDLGLLAVGHHEFSGLSPALNGTTPPAFAPHEHAAILDSPAIAMTGSGFGPAISARVAGAIAGRARNRRERWSPLPPKPARG